MSRKWRNMLRLIVAIVLIVGGGMYLLFQLRFAPIIRRATVLRVENDAAGIINDAIIHAIDAGEVDYNRLITMARSNDNITILKTNMAAVNQLKFSILNEVGKQVQEMDTDEISVPLGNVFLPEFFSGSGPKLSVRLMSLRSSNAQFESQFSEAGINQTRHQIMVNVSIDVTVMTPIGTMDIPVQTNAVVAETIIVGAVPETVMNVDRKDIP